MELRARAELRTSSIVAEATRCGLAMQRPNMRPVLSPSQVIEPLTVFAPEVMVNVSRGTLAASLRSSGHDFEKSTAIGRVGLVPRAGPV